MSQNENTTKMETNHNNNKNWYGQQPRKQNWKSENGGKISEARSSWHNNNSSDIPEPDSVHIRHVRQGHNYLQLQVIVMASPIHFPFLFVIPKKEDKKCVQKMTRQTEISRRHGGDLELTRKFRHCTEHVHEMKQSSLEWLRTGFGICNTPPFDFHRWTLNTNETNTHSKQSFD